MRDRSLCLHANYIKLIFSTWQQNLYNYSHTGNELQVSERESTLNNPAGTRCGETIFAMWP